MKPYYQESTLDQLRNVLRLATILSVWLVVAGGCRGRSEKDYVPQPQGARRAIATALDAWKRGEPPGRISKTVPAIEVGDTHRRPGQRLVSYEILGELPSGDGRQFAVRLQLENPAALEKVNYLVIGIDPLWVFHEHDYKTATHWDHQMTPEAAPQSDRKNAP